VLIIQASQPFSISLFIYKTLLAPTIIDSPQVSATVDACIRLQLTDHYVPTHGILIFQSWTSGTEGFNLVGVFLEYQYQHHNYSIGRHLC